eukprot:TRINITY_DN1602_c0_g1_i1.p1 TRINITY_DN1602_c0_g1~~TRINITY_DN1602_c0_g1_i1.p1  ORF type:complete len:274 (-),score=42.98 TRINITY_DN1602_c0_g1_i1:450-1169(-)
MSEGLDVKLHVYDISMGMAKAMSQAFLGKQIDGVWHTGVVVGNTEYFFGGGIQRATPGQTPFGQPAQVLFLGKTQVTQDIINDFLNDIAPRFNMQTYDLMTNNCNNFSDEFAQFLVGEGIPQHIVGLPQEVANTPMGAMLLQNVMQPMQAALNNNNLGQGSGIAQQQVASAQPSSAQTSSQPQSVNTGVQKKTQQTSQQQKDFDTLVREEFEFLIQQGGLTPDQAAAEALIRVQQKQKA